MPVATRWPFVGRRDELDVFAGALQDPGCQAFCIYGPSGVGKTRLGDECLAVAEADGRRVLRATADQSDPGVPLAAIAHLLPGRALTDWQEGDDSGSVVRARLLDAALRALVPAGDDTGPPVLLLDDAHRVDRSSLTMVDLLLAHGGLFVVATINSGEPVPDSVTQWWREERATRIDLEGLDPVGVDTLLHVVLEGPLDDVASIELWRASHGNLLILHELVLGALADESLAYRDGAWRIDGPVGAPITLGDLIAARIDGLAADGRAVLELLALCQPVGLHQLESSFGLDVLEALEREGLIGARTDGRRQSVSLAHPLHREVLRARVPAEQARSIQVDHAEKLERYGARRREDAVRIATLRLEATGEADPDLLLRAARMARVDNDLSTTVRLAEASFAARPTAVGGLVLGEALFNLGAFEQADYVLETATSQATSEAELVAIITMRRRNLFVGGRRDDEAAAVGRDMVSGASSSGRAELLAGDAELLAYSGRPVEALDLLQQEDFTEPRLAVLAAVQQAAALAMIGRTAEGWALSREAHRDHVALGNTLAVPSLGMHQVNELFALVQAGDLGEADERGRAWFEVALQARMPLEVMWLAVHVARCALVQGRAATARRWADRATTATEAIRFDGLRPITAAFRAAAHGLLGDAAASAAAADEVEGLSPGFGAFAYELPLGRAWALVAGGDNRSAGNLLLTAAEDAERSGFVPTAAWLLHDALRLGATDGIAARLAALTAATDSGLVHLRAEHAAALLADDEDRLVMAGERFEAIGAVLLAAETAAQAADASRRRGHERRAVVLDTVSDTLAARCEGAKTPVLVRAGRVAALSERERDVAVLAARGLSSRQIAAQLTLSVRTVDNHLGRIYAKLGVSSRAALVDALAGPGPKGLT